MNGMISKQMDGLMNEWNDKLTNGWINGWIEGE